MLKIGSKAPAFSLETDERKKVNLKDFLGKKIVLYFYPKDDTPRCTKEACNFTENVKSIQKVGAIVLGVSADSPESHRKFKTKYKLAFPLLSDPDKEVIQKYGVWKEKNMYGRKTMGIERTTFLIDEEGKISHIFPKVKVDGHVEAVLEKLNG